MIAMLRASSAIVLSRTADLALDTPVPLDTRWPYFLTSSPLPGSTVYNLTTAFQSRLDRPLVEFLNTAYRREFEDGEIVGLVLREQTVAAGHAVQ
jgi:hypothetical protein